MKEIGIKIYDKERLLKDTLMGTPIMDNLRWEKLMGREFINGIMEKFTMENGIVA